MNHKRIATPYSGNPSRLRDTEGTIGQHQNKTYNSYQSRSSINPKTKDIYSKHHRMATHHWIIICGIKHHVQVGITTGCGRVDRVKLMRMVMLMKTITAAMIPLPMALRRHRKRGGEVLPLASGGAGALPGPSSSPPSSPTTSPPSSPTLPPSMQRCNLSLPHWNLYLNMVLNAIYYFPMMCGYPMMFE